MAEAETASEDRKDLDKTSTGIDVVHTTAHNPYKEINFLGTYAAVLLGYNACVVGYAMPVSSIMQIEAVLGPSPNSIWVSLAWVLSSSIAFLLLGRLSDIFGRRWFFISSAISGVIGSIIGAVAPKTDVLIAASVFLGLATSAQLSSGISLLELVPMKHRFYAGIMIFISLIPLNGFGPYIARIFIVNTSLGFRGIYYLAIAVNGASALCWILFYYPADFKELHRNRTIKEEIRDLDLGGMFLYVVGFFLFLLGLAWGGSIYPWSSAYTLAPLIVGAALMITFILYEKFANLHRPLVPMHLFRNKNFVILNLVNALVGSVYYPSITLFPTMVATFYTSDLIEQGLLNSCVNVGTCVGAVVMCCLALPGGHFRFKVIFATCGLCAFGAALAGATSSQAVGFTIGFFIGFFVGLVEVLAGASVTIVIDDQSEIGAAVGLFGGFRSAAGVLGTAVYASILQSKIQEYTTTEVVPALAQAGLAITSIPKFLAALASGNSQAVEQVPGVTPSIIQVGTVTFTEAYAQSFKIVWLSTLAFGLLAVLASLFVSDLDDKLLSRIVIRRLATRRKRAKDSEHGIGEQNSTDKA